VFGSTPKDATFDTGSIEMSPDRNPVDFEGSIKRGQSAAKDQFGPWRWLGLYNLSRCLLNRCRTHRCGGSILLPATLAYVSIRGVAAVWTESDDVFFGFGIAASAGLALVVLATSFTHSPMGVYAIPIAVRYEAPVRAHPLYRRVAAHVTAVWAVSELAVTGWEAWHLKRVSATEFVVLRTLVGWPLMAVVVFFLVFYLRFRLDPLAHHLAADNIHSEPVGGAS